MTSDLQLRVIQCMHKNVTKVHSEINEKVKYRKECISGQNKKYRKIKAYMVCCYSSSALSGEVKKFLRERFTFYFHVRFFPYKNRIQFFTQNIER